MAGIDTGTYDLSVKNPNKAEEAGLRDPLTIIEEIAALDAESAEILGTYSGVAVKDGWVIRPLSELVSIRPPKSEAKARLTNSDLVSFLPMEDLGIDSKNFLPKGTRALADVEGSYTYFADGDVLLAKITPCFENGKLGIASGLTNGCGFGSSEFFVIRPTEYLNTEYLSIFLSRASFRVEGARSMGGAVGHQRVTKEFIESYPIPYPPSPNNSASSPFWMRRSRGWPLPPSTPRRTSRTPAIFSMAILCASTPCQGMIGPNAHSAKSLTYA